MNFIVNESSQKLRGGYYTENDIATFLAQWALEIAPKKVLEPSCGDGVFFEAMAQLGANLEAVVGCEIDHEEAMKAKRKGRELNGSLQIAVGDFLDWSLVRKDSEPRFDAVLGNPPFIRYQYLEAELQTRAERIFNKFGLAFTKHTNAWVPFVIASLAMLRPGGRLAMVVPAELLHVIHARSLRHFLLQQCSQVLVIDPEDIWFDNTLQGVVLLLAQKKADGDSREARVAITRVRGRESLNRPAREYFDSADFFPGSVLNGKWMLGLLNRSERSLVEQLTNHSQVRAFRDIASVDVGIVTGANKFFLVPDETVREYQLEKWARPMFGRSEHVRGVIYGKSDQQENRRRGLPANFIAFQPNDELSQSAKKYVRFGETQDLHTRYKCRIRSPWYSVPSVYTAPAGMLKRCHHFPRMILNAAKAYTTDTAYRIVPNGISASDLVFSFVNSLTALSAELEGRHYGGGVLELVPSEIERMLIPVVSTDKKAIVALDAAVRADTQPEELLARQDALILAPLGIGKRDCEELLGAWMKLRSRRHRTDVGET